MRHKCPIIGRKVLLKLLFHAEYNYQFITFYTHIQTSNKTLLTFDVFIIILNLFYMLRVIITSYGPNNPLIDHLIKLYGIKLFHR
jgi:hypothetical protein